MITAAKLTGDILRLDCQGDQHTMGLQQGQALATLLATIDEDLAEALHLPCAGQTLGGLSEYARRRAIPRLSQAVALAGSFWLRRRLEQTLPGQAERIAGLAEGAGLGRLAYLPPLVELVFGSKVSGGCTAVAVGPERSASGEPFLGKNLDASSHRLGTYLVRRNHPLHGLRSIELTDATMTGCLDGVNEAGLALSCNYRILSRTLTAGLPPSLLCKELLERCETVQQAVQQISSWSPTRPALILLLDRAGAIATVDITDRCQVRWHQGLAVQTNHHAALSETGATSQQQDCASAARSERMQTLLGAEQISVAQLKAALADHHPAANDQSICRHGGRLTTRCSLVLSPQAAGMEVLKGSPCSGAYVSVSLAAGDS